jgi:hypothetical protein
MENKIKKFFSYEDGGIVLHPPFMGSDRWCLRNADDYFLEFGVDQFTEHEGVFVEDGNHLLQLVELDDFVCFCVKFVVKGRQIIVEDVICRNEYKKNYISIMPDRGIYEV